MKKLASLFSAIVLLPAVLHAASISGKITTGAVGGAAGTPVVGAKVVLTTFGGGGGGGGGTTRLDSTTSGAEGAYSFTLDTTGFRQILVTADGYNDGSATVNVLIDSAYTANVNLSVEGATGSITGTVTSGADSTPVAGAQVIVRRQGGGGGGTAFTPDTLVTNAEGKYTFDSVPENTGYIVTASATGFALTTRNNVTVSSVAPVTVNLHLSPPPAPGSITGKVAKASDSSALAGARVILSRTGGGGAGFTPDTLLTDAEGKYTFDSVAANTGYILAVSLAGYTTQTRNNVTVTASQAATQNFYLALPVPPGSVAGKVTKASDGSAIAGATVILTRTGGGGAGFTPDTLTTDAQGAFDFDSIPNNNNYTLTVSATGFATTLNNNVDVTGGLETKVDFALAAAVAAGDTTGTIKGVITDAATKAVIANATVILTQTTGGGGGGGGTALDTVTTNAQGEFMFDSLATVRSYRVNASSGTLTGVSNTVSLAAGVTFIADLALAPAVGIVPSQAISRSFQSRWVNGRVVLDLAVSLQARSVEVYTPNGALKYRIPVAPGEKRVVLPAGITPALGALVRIGK